MIFSRSIVIAMVAFCGMGLGLVTASQASAASGRNCRDWRQHGQPDPREFVCEGAKVFICPRNIYTANKCHLVTIESLQKNYSTGFVMPITIETTLKSTTYVLRDERGQHVTIDDTDGTGGKWGFFATKGCVESTSSDASFCVGEQMTDAQAVEESEPMIGPGKLIALELGMGGSYTQFGILKTADGYKQIWAQGMYMTDSRADLTRMNKKAHDKQFRDPWEEQAR
jgi:hypothetical protein